MLRYIWSIIRLVLRIATYTLAFLLFLLYAVDAYRFRPLNIIEGLALAREISFGQLVGVLFSRSHFGNLIFPIGLIASITMLGTYSHLMFHGLGDAMIHEMNTGRYDWVTENGTVVGHGDDGAYNAAIVVGIRLAAFACLLALSLAIMPFLIVWDIIKLVMTTVQVVTNGF